MGRARAPRSKPARTRAKPPQDDTHKKLVQLLKQGIPARRAAGVIGLAPETVRNWVRQGREGDPRYAPLAKAVAEGLALHHLRIAKAGADHWQASAWLLERMDPDAYGATVHARSFLEKAREALLEAVEECLGREAADRLAEHLARKAGLAESGSETD